MVLPLETHQLVSDAMTLESESVFKTLESESAFNSKSSPKIGKNKKLVLQRTNCFTVHPNTQNSLINVRGNFIHNGASVQIIKNVQPSVQRVQRRSNALKNPKTRTINAMMKSREPINEEVMDIISSHLGERWRFLFRRLGYSNGQIDQVVEDYYRNNKEQIYRLLLDYSRNDDDSSLGHITNLMWKNGFEECVQKLKNTWKNLFYDRGIHCVQ